MTRENEIAAIEKLANDWSAGWERSDTEALLSLFTSDPVLLPQGQPAIAGIEAIRATYQALFAEYAIKGEGKVVEISLSGDMGYWWSSYTLTATSKATGEQTTVAGKSLFIVKRQNGDAWKIHRLMDNSDREPSANT